MIFIDVEGAGDTPLEAGHAEAWTDIVAPDAAFRAYRFGSCGCGVDGRVKPGQART